MRDGNQVPRDDVARMFDEIAPVYDRLNTVMTLGLDRGWRRAAVEASGVRPGAAVADIACGTGRLTAELAERVGPFGKVIGVDLSGGMLEYAIAAYRDLVQVEFRHGDALALPIEDDAVDAATIGFGLRNLDDFEGGFRELARIVRPGGRVVCLELTLPRPRWWGRLYHATFRRTAPFAGSVVGRTKAYRYLPESLEGFPDADRLAATMRSAGLVHVAYRRLGLGIVAIHHGDVAVANGRSGQAGGPGASGSPASSDGAIAR
jgi:demethylmenaquinone methyltransferase/2-methoxy-6-polyprenyl-1,4-benzoquinol methylase